MMHLHEQESSGAVDEGEGEAFAAGIVFRFPDTSIGEILRSTNGAPARARLVAFKAVLMLIKSISTGEARSNDYSGLSANGRGRGILYPDWVRTWVREVFDKKKGIRKGVTIPRNPLFLLMVAGPGFEPGTFGL